MPVEDDSRETTASVHLNMCAVYSSMGKHEKALTNAHIALSILNKVYVRKE